MKRHGVPIGLGVVLIAVAVLLRGRGSAAATPEDAVTALFDAAQRGDASAYLQCFGEPLQTTIAAETASGGSVAEALRRTVAGLKGLAMTRATATQPDAVALDVELIFAQRNQRQRFTLVPRGGGWVIVALERADTLRPEVRYGTPVFEAPNFTRGVGAEKRATDEP